MSIQLTSNLAGDSPMAQGCPCVLFVQFGRLKYHNNKKSWQFDADCFFFGPPSQNMDSATRIVVKDGIAFVMDLGPNAQEKRFFSLFFFLPTAPVSIALRVKN